MNLELKKSQTGRACGFSLVEVALAVAIAALAIITLLGLLPQGLEMSRKTSLSISNSSITEQVIRNLENTQWSQLPTIGKKIRYYYNNEAAEVAASSDELTFVAEVEFMGPSYLPQQSKIKQNYLQQVIIRIANSNTSKFEFLPTKQLTYTTNSYCVAKTR